MGVAAVGTRNPVKLRAAERVFRRYMGLRVVAVPVAASVPGQPVGLDELVRGALERAYKARLTAGALYGVGVEAGLLEFPTSTGFIETQVAAIVGPGLRVSLGASSSFELPPWLVSQMLGGVELREAYSRRVRRGSRDVGEGVGYIGVETWGHMTRQDLTEQAIEAAILPWLRGGEWLQRVEDLARSVGARLEPH
jgi:inosine/xanthosine triphosphatase